MGGMLACLRGWHPALAKAELVALLPAANLSPTASPRWWTVQQTTEDERSEAEVELHHETALVAQETADATGRTGGGLDVVDGLIAKMRGLCVDA